MGMILIIKLRGKYEKSRGTTLLELMVYLAISSILVVSTLSIMNSYLKNTNAQLKSSYKVNRLYTAINIISNELNKGDINNVVITGNKIKYTDKVSGMKKSIYKVSTTLILVMGSKSYFFLDDIKEFICKTKGNLLYVFIKLNTGEEMRECIKIEN